ncbi:DUF892 family protein [Halobacteria archaeon AArc-dxtr1]|nr:DUF892 family protein [Halobacteria archaeon AArc-dxtr1]
MTLNTLEDMFEHALRQMYYVETQLVEALDEMAINATNDRISEGFAEHREETREHVSRLEDVFDEIGATPAPTEDAVFDGLETERQTLEEQIEDDELLNMAYIGAGMHTERIEMTGYENLLMLSKKLGHDSAVTDLLEANHDEEQSTYRELDAMATASDMKAFWDRITPS